MPTYEQHDYMTRVFGVKAGNRPGVQGTGGPGAGSADPAPSPAAASPSPSPDASASEASPANITIPTVRLAPGGDRNFQFNFTQVRNENGATPEDGQFGISVTQSGEELGRANGVPRAAGLRVTTGGFQSSQPVVTVTISGEAPFTRFIYENGAITTQSGKCTFAVTKTLRVDAKAKEYTFQVSRHDETKTVTVKSSETHGSNRESVAAAKVGVGVDKIVSVSGEASNQTTSGDKSEEGNERTEQWTVRWYTGDLELTII